MSSQQTSAIVIGGSIAGLLASRVLSAYYDRVTIIERDTLPDSAEYRNGTPQAHHLHILLAQGQRLLEQLFPNIEQDFESQGAPHICWGMDSAVRSVAGWVDRFDSGIHSHVISRITLEWIIRERILAIPNITIMTQQQVNHLVTNDNNATITGVNITSRTNKYEQNLSANLIVDTSGRGSKAMQWLQDMGYSAPEETVIDSHLGYATRWYQLPEDMSYLWTIMLIQADPKRGLNRGGGMFIVEGNRLVITLAGANKDYPPTDEVGFMEFAKSLSSPIMYDVIKDLTPISPLYGYRRTENRFRHYEKLSRMPEGFIVMGDAACGFNPVYGQGMTAAALEVRELNDLLQTTDVRNLGDFSLTFQKRLSKAVDGAWVMATGEDLRYPETEGAKPTIVNRITHRYMDHFMEVTTHDPILNKAFLEAWNLTVHPISLFHPKYALRVLHHRLFNTKVDSMAESDVELTAIPTV